MKIKERLKIYIKGKEFSKEDLEDRCKEIDELSNGIIECKDEILKLKERKQCKNCYEEIELEARYCPSCGCEQEVEECKCEENKKEEKCDCEEEN